MTRPGSNFPSVGDPDATAKWTGEQCRTRIDAISARTYGDGWRCTRPMHPDDRCLAGDGTTIRAAWRTSASTAAAKADDAMRDVLVQIMTVEDVARFTGKAVRTIRWHMMEGSLVIDDYIGRTPVFFRHRVEAWSLADRLAGRSR